MADSHKWEFRTRFRRNAFGWKSQPAIQRVKQAVAEIRKVARRDPLLAAEGAVLFLERVSPALERVDSSSGAIGTAVNNASAELVPLIANAPADAGKRERWLERLWEAHAADAMPYIETLADHWGELCGSQEVASSWADRLIDITRMALSPDPKLRGHFHGTPACLSALYHAQRYGEIVELLAGDTIWPYRRWAVRALAAMGRKAEAIRYAESSRGPWSSDADIDALCEEILLSSGLAQEAYERYGVHVRRGATYLAAFRSVCRRYPDRPAATVLADLVATTPGEEGKWFAAANDAGLYDEALALARQSPTDPRTLARAARDHVADRPAFSVEAGLLALHWLAQGYGYDITAVDVSAAYGATMKAAAQLDNVHEVEARIRQLIANAGRNASFVSAVLRI